MVHQLGPGDGRHPGEELVPRTVASAVLYELEVADRGEEPERIESVELLTPLVVGEIYLLDYQLLEDGVRPLLGGYCPQVR